MIKYLLPKEGKFYKANLHMHTNISDGVMTVEETKKAFVEKGYSIVAFTDHEVMVPHVDLSDENFLAITSSSGISEKAIAGISFRYVSFKLDHKAGKSDNNGDCPISIVFQPSGLSNVSLS